MRVAVIGAGNDRAKFGNKAVRSYVSGGHEVFPVHPKETVVEGLRAFPDIGSVPGGPVDRALLYVPASVGVGLLQALAAAGVGEVWVNPGAESPELFAEADRLGLEWVFACAIVDIGDSPARYGT